MTFQFLAAHKVLRVERTCSTEIVGTARLPMSPKNRVLLVRVGLHPWFLSAGIGSRQALTVWEQLRPTLIMMGGRTFTWLATAPRACFIAIIRTARSAKLRSRLDARSTRMVLLCRAWAWL